MRFVNGFFKKTGREAAKTNKRNARIRNGKPEKIAETCKKLLQNRILYVKINKYYNTPARIRAAADGGTI